MISFILVIPREKYKKKKEELCQFRAQIYDRSNLEKQFNVLLTPRHIYKPEGHLHQCQGVQINPFLL